MTIRLGAWLLPAFLCALPAAAGEMQPPIEVSSVTESGACGAAG